MARQETRHLSGQQCQTVRVIHAACLVYFAHMVRSYHFTSFEQSRLRFNVEVALQFALLEALHTVDIADFARLARETTQREVRSFIEERGSRQRQANTS